MVHCIVSDFDMAPNTPAVSRQPATILCVDDEANILAALRRAFRPLGYQILLAESAKEGLLILEQNNHIDLIISDMRMPEMDGARFLAQVRNQWPDITRILLTGYADMESTIAAINEGQIYRHISKPWNDDELLLTVRDALERRALEQEKRRLERLTADQNAELKQLNASLEEKVSERTQELVLANEKLKHSFFTSIQLFSNMLELRAGHMAGHSCRVADLSRKVARELKLDETECQNTFLAALLHDIGKIGLPDDLLRRPINQMSGDELSRWRRHPSLGEQALLALDSLRGVAAVIRSHHETFDGRGFPDGKSGMTIPIGARILSVANEYDGYIWGTLNGKRYEEESARQMIAQGRGKRYDPEVVDAFLTVTGGIKKSNQNTEEVELTTGELKVGMVLSRNLVNYDGIVLLTAQQTLTEQVITQLRGFEHSNGSRLEVWIKAASVH
jgi:response regulator RpfG family c-di-GMP phosphodiesterase